MRKLFVLFSIVIFLSLQATWYPFTEEKNLSVLPLNLINQKSNIITIKLSLQGMNVEKSKNGFVKITIPEGQIYKEIEGDPAIPYFRRRIGMPDKGKPIITITNIKKQKLLDKFNIIPAQPPLPEIRGYKPQWKYNEKTYQTDKFLPGKIAEITNIEIIRSFRTAQLNIYPIQYNPKTGEIEVITECNITITFKGKGEKELNRTIPITPRWESIYKELIWNYDFIKDTKPYYDNLHNSINRDTRKATKALNDLGFFDEGDYIVFLPGTSGDISGAMKEFLGWKLKLGYMPEVHWVDPAITPENLRDIIQTFYSDADANHTDPNITPEFVLIVGEGEENEVAYHIEAHPADFSSVYTYGVESGIVRNDHFFSLMDDTTDYHSDIFVARFSVDDTVELKLWIDKTMRYEGNPPEGDWYYSAFAIGDTEDTRIFNLTARQFMLNLVNDGNYIEIDTMLEENYADGAMVGPVQDSLDDGHNIMVFRGHGDEGSTFGWYGGANNGYDEWIDNTYLQNISTTSLGVGFVFAPTCLANNFTYPNIDAIGETFINTGLTVGAVGYFGATNVSLSFYNDSMALGISHALTGATATTEFQVVSVYGKNYMETYTGGTSTYFKLEHYLMNELGDPAARIWTKAPLTLTVEHDTTYYTGTDTVIVTVYDATNKAVVPNATVVLWDTTGTDNLYAKDITDAAGQAQFIVNLADTGTAELMISVSKADYIPYTGTADVITLGFVSANLMATEDNGNVVLNWNINGNLTSDIEIYRNNELIYKGNANDNTFTDTNPIIGINTYSIKSNGKELAKAVIKINGYSFAIIGTNTYNSNTPLIRFTLPTNGNVTISVYDISGHKIYDNLTNAHKGLNEIKINSLTNKGIYFVKLKYKNETKTTKLLITE